MLSLMYGILKRKKPTQKQKTKLLGTENRLVVAKGRVGEGAKWVKGVKKYRLPAVT